MGVAVAWRVVVVFGAEKASACGTGHDQGRSWAVSGLDVKTGRTWHEARRALRRGVDASAAD